MLKAGFHRIAFTCFLEIWRLSFLVEGRSNIESVKRGGSFFGTSSVAGAFDLEGLVFGGRAGE